MKRHRPGAAGPVAPARERDAAIVIAREQGETLREIGSRFGISRERVRRILVDAGGPDSARSKRARAQRESAVAEACREEVLAAWRAGSEPKAIAARLGLSRARVGSVLASHASAADHAARRLALQGAAGRSGPRGYSDEALIGAVRQVVRDAGHVVACKEYGRIAKGSDLPSLSTLENRFGGWNAVLEAAGLTPIRAPRRPHSRRWTEESCLEAMRVLVAELGELPSTPVYDGLSRGRSDLPSSATLRNRLGSWSRLALLLEPAVDASAAYEASEASRPAAPVALTGGGG